MLKKLWIPAILLISTGTVLATSASASSYRFYNGSKTESGQQFDFDANEIASEIVLDGQKDALYSAVLDFGTKTRSGIYDVNLYAYHGEQALYLLFDVYDEHVTKRAIGANNAQDEDGVEIYIDPLLDGGTAGHKDDYRIYLGVSGYSKVNKGTGDGFSSDIIGFGGELKTSLKEGTVPNDETDTDTGYYLEYRIPYISISGEANKSTPLAFAFVHTTVQAINGSRTRTGLSGHPTFKIPYADVPNNYSVLTGENRFYTKANFLNLNENTPSVMGKVVNKYGEAISNVSIKAYYEDLRARLYHATTDANGYFSFENIDTRCDFIVEASRGGFLSCTLIYDKDNLVNANGAEYYQLFTLLPSSQTKRTVTGQITALDGDDLSGVNVSVSGFADLSAVTNASGEYSIEVYSEVDSTLVFKKSGFETRRLVVNKDTSVVPTFELSHTIVTLLNPKSLSLLNNYARAGLVRGKNSIFVKIYSPYIIKDRDVLSVYFNTGNKTAFNNHYFDGDLRLDFTNNEANLYKYSEAQNRFVLDNTGIEGVAIQIESNVLFETTLSIPYSLLGISSSATFGSAIAFYNGEEYQENLLDSTYAIDEEVDPFSTMTYLRFAADGKVYFSNNNQNTDFLYFYHAIDGAVSEDIPNNADHIYMTYERSSTGLKIFVTVDEGLGNHFNTSTNLVGQEAVNILLNLDGVDLSAWALYKAGSTCYDINLRIYGDGSVCYTNSAQFAGQASNQMWWSDKAHNNGVAKNFTLVSHTLPEENYEVEEGQGYKTYVFNFTYADLLEFGGAPSGTTMDDTSPIGTELYEISETSKTTVRFYTSSGDGWLFKNRELSKTMGAFSGQSGYVPLEKNK